MMIDVDYFKVFNDEFGHLAGDRCLQQVAQAMQGVMQRPGDELCRYGGEEFAVILPETDEQGALYVAQKIQQAIQKLEITAPKMPDNATSFVTVSLGVAIQIPKVDDKSSALIDQADKALYAAKKQGRNTCVVYTDEI